MDNILNNVKVFREKNGLELIYIKIPFLQSCTVSIMIKTGSVYEKKSLRGGAHLLEHLLFKGNKQYKTQLELSKKLESMGAQYNAYTDSNMVSFHVKVQKDYLNETITILGNMIANSFIKHKDIEEEKLVVIQELEKDKDLPAKYVYELINEILYKDNRYSRPIGGNKQTVKDITDKEIHDFWKSNYNSKNIVISVAGNIEISDLRIYISNSPFLNGDLPVGSNNKYYKPYRLQNKIQYNYEIRENMNQIQLCISFPTFNYKDKRKYALDVLKVILAGPMSSRLFIAIRNTYGLGYNVSSHANLNNIYGDLTIATGVDGSELFSNKLNLDNDKKADPIKVILEEVFNLCKKKITLEELNLSKDYIKGNVILESEDTENISQFYGKQRIVGEKIITLQRYIDHIENITINDIHKLSIEIFKPEHINISLIGNLNKKKMEKDMSEIVSRYKKFLEEV